MYVPGLGSGGRESDCDMRSANGSAGFEIGTPVVEDFFLVVGGVTSLTPPSEDVRLSVRAESEPLPEALRARREGGLLAAAPRDLVCRGDQETHSLCNNTATVEALNTLKSGQPP